MVLWCISSRCEYVKSVLKALTYGLRGDPASISGERGLSAILYIGSNKRTTVNLGARCAHVANVHILGIE